jgi:hypothetical protein
MLVSSTLPGPCGLIYFIFFNFLILEQMRQDRIGKIRNKLKLNTTMTLWTPVQVRLQH